MPTAPRRFHEPSAVPRSYPRPARPTVAVFLDRDGVINRSEIRNGKPYAPRRLKEFRLLPGAANATARLRQAGFLIVVVTNQPDIGNGWVAAETVASMHEKLRRRLAPDAIEMCPHAQDEGCACRKPKPGLLKRAARRFGIDFASSFMVGDRWSDVVAGQAVGCYTIFVDRGYRDGEPARPDAVVASLPAAASLIIELASSRRMLSP